MYGLFTGCASCGGGGIGTYRYGGHAIRARDMTGVNQRLAVKVW